MGGPSSKSGGPRGGERKWPFYIDADGGGELKLDGVDLSAPDHGPGEFIRFIINHGQGEVTLENASVAPARLPVERPGPGDRDDAPRGRSATRSGSGGRHLRAGQPAGGQPLRHRGGPEHPPGNPPGAGRGPPGHPRGARSRADVPPSTAGWARPAADQRYLPARRRPHHCGDRGDRCRRLGRAGRPGPAAQLPRRVQQPLLPEHGRAREPGPRERRPHRRGPAQRRVHRVHQPLRRRPGESGQLEPRGAHTQLPDDGRRRPDSSRSGSCSRGSRDTDADADARSRADSGRTAARGAFGRQRHLPRRRKPARRLRAPPGREHPPGRPAGDGSRLERHRGPAGPRCGLRLQPAGRQRTQEDRQTCGSGTPTSASRRPPAPTPTDPVATRTWRSARPHGATGATSSTWVTPPMASSRSTGSA